jgi:hypothetical protein
MTKLSALLEFFDRICLEDSLYFVVPDVYGKNSYELQWDRKASIQNWRIRKLGNNNWHHASAANIADIIHLEKIDVAKLISELSTNLLTQAVFARTLLKGVEELLGKDKIDEAEKQTQIFIDQIKSIAASHTDSGIEAVSSNAALQIKTSKPNKPFRIVRNDDQTR